MATLSISRTSRRVLARASAGGISDRSARRKRAMATQAITSSPDSIRWQNLDRCTDPIGLPLFSVDRCVDGAEPDAPDEIDVLLHDPGHEPPAPGDPFSPVRGHSNYYLEPGIGGRSRRC